MVYKTGTNYALIKRSIKGSPLRGGIYTFMPPRPKRSVRPAQYIGVPVLDAHLAEVLRGNEHLRAVVRGQMSDGAALFAATDRRIVILAQSASSVRVMDISLDMVAGLDAKRQDVLTCLTIFTNNDTYTIQTLDRASVQHFVECVDLCHQTQHMFRELW